MDYFLIKWNNEKSIVQANNGLEAVRRWFEEGVEQRAKEGQLIKFNPREFSVENIGSEVMVARKR
ncbi:hypothetical protein SporoP37_15950 [Sporosarcina sp. P37]|uniref:hypothetical protein n=1 Tax=unclassified Sporosarcina TaxID=2647733 RepID=UPI000A17EDE2|nr:MULTISPECIES: hypothetical protein [unclassified Sporosarcina]ARK26019.1 hypothetical protein SporoP37_15950 [Sporosarcina sp. P37]PID19388.1 hypothetical protein CSV62_02470 [Sporosarcina sp. P35]